jgi:pimeloyl-ACP methyl ester carboxylesterase
MTDHPIRSDQLIAGLAADTVGVDDERAPLVLLHGLTFDRTMWQPALDDLARIDSGRRILNIDLPGHGESPPRDSYDGLSVVHAVHAAVTAAGLDTPVLVGHSASGVTATFYAGHYPTRGVINVDGAPDVAGLAPLRAVAAHLDDRRFTALWQQLLHTMHVELLPSTAQELLRRTSTPDRELVVGYWQNFLQPTMTELTEGINEQFAVLRRAATPYTLVTGAPLSDTYLGWLRTALPNVRVENWFNSGHFPHLAHPHRFAQLLRQTARWPSSTESA